MEFFEWSDFRRNERQSELHPTVSVTLTTAAGAEERHQSARLQGAAYIVDDHLLELGTSERGESDVLPDQLKIIALAVRFGVHFF